MEGMGSKGEDRRRRVFRRRRWRELVVDEMAGGGGGVKIGGECLGGDGGDG